jgi:hypothetical protein
MLYLRSLMLAVLLLSASTASAMTDTLRAGLWTRIATGNTASVCREVLVMSQNESRVLDLLLQIRAGRHRPWFLPFIGEPNILVLWGFLLGIEAARLKWHGVDAEYVDFRDWLRDEKNEFPPEGWHMHFLADSQGDHFVAIMRFLDRVAEFRERAVESEGA